MYVCQNEDQLINTFQYFDQDWVRSLCAIYKYTTTFARNEKERLLYRIVFLRNRLLIKCHFHMKEMRQKVFQSYTDPSEI